MISLNKKKKVSHILLFKYICTHIICMCTYTVDSIYYLLNKPKQNL